MLNGRNPNSCLNCDDPISCERCDKKLYCLASPKCVNHFCCEFCFLLHRIIKVRRDKHGNAII